MRARRHIALECKDGYIVTAIKQRNHVIDDEGFRQRRKLTRQDGDPHWIFSIWSL
jgi:hypothetical protein